MKRLMRNNLKAKEMETRNLNKIERLSFSRCTISVCVKSTWNVCQVCDKIIHWSQLKTGVGGQNLIFFILREGNIFTSIFLTHADKNYMILYFFLCIDFSFACIVFFLIYLTLHEKSSLWGLYYLSMMRKNQNGKYSEFRDLLCTQTLVLNALFSRISRITSETQMISLIVIIHRQKYYFCSKYIIFLKHQGYIITVQHTERNMCNTQRET